MLHKLHLLLMQKRHIEQLKSDAAELSERLHRLEIALRQVTERVDQVEGSHAALSHSVRGRLGGRGNKAPGSGHAPLFVVPPAM